MVMEMNLDNDSTILTRRPTDHHIISIGDQHLFPEANYPPTCTCTAPAPAPAPAPHSDWFQKNSRILAYILVGALIIMYPPLAAMVQLRFQSEKHSPFETHFSFMVMSVGALIIAAWTSGFLFYIRDDSQSSFRKHFSLVHYMILKVVFCFSGILGPLSLVLTLFVPHNLKWIGYLIVCTLFMVVAGCNVCSYTKLLDKKD